MGKTLDELLPQDDVVIEIAAQQDYDAVKREIVIVKEAKQMVVKKEYFDSTYNEDGRQEQFDCEIIGTPIYEEQVATNLPGVKMNVLIGVAPLETEAGRLAAKLKAEAEAKAEADRIAKQEAADRKAAEDAAKKAKAEADKQEAADRKAAEDAAKLAANNGQTQA